MKKINDTDFEDCVVKTATPTKDGFDVLRADGWGLFVPKVDGAAPRAGSKLRIYGRGIGFPFRGIDVDGVEVFYRTPEEEEAKRLVDLAESERRRRDEFTRDVAKHDAVYAALPEPLRRRLDGFRATSPDWRWQFEPYEAFTCAEAAKIADALKTPDAVREFARVDHDEQRRRVKLDDGHSGNTFGMACRLALWLVKEPENAVREHAAICGLLGCKEVGCPPARVAVSP